MAQDRNLFRSFNFHETGLERVLGSLEAQLLQRLWHRGRASAREICNDLDGQVTFNTVMKVLTRLRDKGLVLRYGKPRSYQFEARYSREQLENIVAEQVYSGLFADFGDVAIAQLIEVIGNLDDKKLEELRGRLNDIRHE